MGQLGIVPVIIIIVVHMIPVVVDFHVVEFYVNTSTREEHYCRPGIIHSQGKGRGEMTRIDH